MKMITPSRWTSIALLMLSLALVRCIKDDGLTLPGSEGGLTPLRHFQGSAWNEGDSALSAKRFLKLRNPKIALVWQKLGPGLQGQSFDKGVVAVSAPYEFSVDMTGPPPIEIAQSTEPVIGSFWLYSDGNGNGTLDRVAHPEMQARQRDLDSLRLAYEAADDSLQAVSTLTDHRVPYRDTFRLDVNGNLTHARGGAIDTLYAGMESDEVADVWAVLFRRTLALCHLSSWEFFFSLRKKGWEAVITRQTVPGGGAIYVTEDWRKLFPLPGREGEFEMRLAKAGSARYRFSVGLAEALYLGEKNHWVDYPYEGFETAGLDWVAGKSRWYSVLYFPNRAALEQVVEAERSASFRVNGLDELHTGYNLLHCDDQYVCDVLSEKDSIRIDLGEEDAYFNAPSSALTPAIRDYSPAEIPEGSLERLEGAYDLHPFHPVTVVSRAGALWADFPGRGVLRLTGVDPYRFYDKARTLQFEFVRGSGGGISKLMTYVDGARWVAVKLEGPGRRQAVLAAVDSLLALPRNPPGAALAASLPLRLESGKDTLALSGEGDSLRLAKAGGIARFFHPLNDSESASSAASDRLRLERNDQGAVRGAWLITAEGERFLPNPAYVPRKPIDLFPLAGDESPDADSQANPVSASAGTGRDTYLGLGGVKRYGCSEDGFFLREGDGWLAELRKEGTSDSISLHSHSGELVFRIEGLAGKRVRLEIDLCKEKAGNPARGRFRVLGGARSGEWERTLAEDGWTPASEKGGTLAWESLPIPSDPYYLGIQQVRTADSLFLFAVDGYRILSN
jgi:hypothetical protein